MRKPSYEFNVDKDQEPHPLNYVSSHSFVIYDCINRDFVVSKKETMKREVASLTKMMTLYTVIRLMSKWNMNPKNVSITVSQAAATVTGTSANLVEGDVLTVE